MNTGSHHALGALLRALIAGPVAIAEAGALLAAPEIPKHRNQKIGRYRRDLNRMGFTTELCDGVITLTGGETWTAIQATQEIV